MSGLPKALEKIIDSFSRLPGIGKKTAQRLGMYIMKMDNEFVSDFANALLEIENNIYSCSICNNFSDSETCSICSDPTRRSRMICIVENPSDIILFENTGFNGFFHVLGGRKTRGAFFWLKIWLRNLAAVFLEWISGKIYGCFE